MRSTEVYKGGSDKNVRGSTSPHSTTTSNISTSNASEGEASVDEGSGTSGSTAWKLKSCSGHGGPLFPLFRKRKLMDARHYRSLFKPLRKKAMICGADWTCQNGYHSPDSVVGSSKENNSIDIIEIRDGYSDHSGKSENCSGEDGKVAGKGSISSLEVVPEGILDDGKEGKVMHSCKYQECCVHSLSMPNCEQSELLPECGDGLLRSSQSLTIVKDSGDPNLDKPFSVNETIDKHIECSTKESPYVPVIDLQDGSVLESPTRTVVTEGFCSDIHALRVNDISCVQEISNTEAVPTSCSGSRTDGDIAKMDSSSVNSESELEEGEIRESYRKNICHEQKIMGNLEVMCSLEISPVKLQKESLKDGLLVEQIVLIKKTCDKRMKELLQKQGVELEGFKAFKETEKVKIKNKNDQDRYDQHFKSQRRKLVVMQISARTEEMKRKEQWLRDAYAGKLSKSFDAVPLPDSRFIAEAFRETCNQAQTSDCCVSSGPSVCFSGKQDWKGEMSIKVTECSPELGYRCTRIQTKRTDDSSNKVGVIGCRYGKNDIGLRNKVIADCNRHSRVNSNGTRVVSPQPSQTETHSIVTHSSNWCKASAFTHQVSSALCESTSCIKNNEQWMILSPKVVDPMQHLLGTVPGIAMDSVKSADVKSIDHDMLVVSGKLCPGQKLSFAEPIAEPETDKSTAVGCQTPSTSDGFISGRSSHSSQNVTSTLESDENAVSVEYERPAVSDAVKKSSLLSSSQAAVVPFIQSANSMPPEKLEDQGISDHVEGRQSYKSLQLITQSFQTSVPEPSTEHEEHATSDEVRNGQMLSFSQQNLATENQSRNSDPSVEHKSIVIHDEALGSLMLSYSTVSHSAEAVPHAENEAFLSVVNSGHGPDSSLPIMIPNLQLTGNMPSAEHERPVMPGEAPSGSLSHSSMVVNISMPPPTDASHSSGLLELMVSDGASSDQVPNSLLHITDPVHPTDGMPPVDHEISAVLGIGSGELCSSQQLKASMIQSTNDMLPAIENEVSIMHGVGSSKVEKSGQSIADYMEHSADALSSAGLSVNREEPVIFEGEAGCTINSQTSKSLPSNNNDVLEPVQAFFTSCQDVLYDEPERSSEPAVIKTMQGPNFPPPTSVPAESTEVANLQVEPFSEAEILGSYCAKSSSSTLLHSVDHDQTNLYANMINEEMLHTEANLSEPSVINQIGVSTPWTGISGLPSPDYVTIQLETQRNAHVGRTTNDNRHASTEGETNTSMAQPFFISSAVPLRGFYAHPLDNELLRICREEALANQIKWRLQSELESELNKVQKKYEMLLRGAEEAFSQKKQTLDMIYIKICRNQLLAKEFSTKFADNEDVVGRAVLPGMPSNISQLFVQRENHSFRSDQCYYIIP